MKKRKALILTIMLVIGVLFSGCSAITNNIGNVEYKIVGDHAEVIALPNGSDDTDIVINDKYDGVPVTVIRDFAGNNLESATTIHIGKNVKEIGKWAFSNNQKLAAYDVDDDNMFLCDIDGVLYSKDVKVLYSYPCAGNTTFAMPNTIETINARAFYKNENITSVTLSTNLKTIEEMAFFQCKLIEKIDFPNTLESIGKDAFTKCEGLTQLNIPSSITSISDYAFYNCTSVEKVVVNKKENEISLGNKWYPTNNGINMDTLEIEWKD